LALPLSQRYLQFSVIGKIKQNHHCGTLPTIDAIEPSIEVQAPTLEEFKWDILPHSPYSPDIAPSNYHLFRSMTHGLVEQHFTSYEEAKNWVDS